MNKRGVINNNRKRITQWQKRTILINQVIRYVMYPTVGKNDSIRLQKDIYNQTLKIG